MPNIEIRGFKNIDSPEADALKLKIDSIMKKIGLENDAITDIVASKAESCDGIRKPMPYVRVCNTDIGEKIFILKKLKEYSISIDTEGLDLSHFIPADEMK
ncbi:MAG: hypothetical protein ABIJ28_02315 [Patescibacteria group bacterium]